MDIIYVTGDDWCGLYTDGALHMEGHSIDAVDILDWIAAMGHLDISSFQIKDANLDWLTEVGSLPAYFTDVVLAGDYSWRDRDEA